MDSLMGNTTSEDYNLKRVKPTQRLNWGASFSCLLFFPGPSPDLTGRIPVNFLEHAAEQFVIGKSVLVEHLQDGFVRRADVVVDVGEPHVVDMLREGNADILAEHAAEIVAVEAEDIRDLFEGQRLHIVLVDV